MNKFPVYKRRLSEQNTRALLGGGAILSFLATSEDTNGLYAMFEAKGVPGMEPPPHTHTREDETYYILEGEMYFKVGDKEFVASKGDFVFLPRNVRHEFKVLSDSFHCHIGMFPGGLDEYFIKASIPHNSKDIPALDTAPPSQEVMEGMMKLNQEYGITN